MNAKSLSLLFILSVSLAQASPSVGIPDLFMDPLGSAPPILERGPFLPDQSAIVCPASIDLNHPLSLNEVVDLGLCNNPQIKQAWAAIKIQAGAVGEARAAYLPTANASLSPQQTQVNYPQYTYANSITNGQIVYANLNWRLFDFGGRGANRASANLLLQSALASHDASLQKAMAVMIGNYFDALTAQATLKSKELASKYAQTALEATLRRESKGASDKSDTLQAQTALAKAQLASNRAQGEYRKALASLVFAMGLNTQSKLTLQDPQEQTQKQSHKDLGDWLNAAQKEHPAIKSAKAKWESSQEKITTARSEGLPTIDFSGNFNRNGYPNQGLTPTKSNTTSVGLVLTIPIFEGFSRTYKIRGAQAQAELAQAQMEEVEHQILTEIVKSHADAMSSVVNLDASEKLLEAANSAVQSSIKRYNMGAADILELLSTQTALADAQQEKIRCVSEWRSARLRLLASAGLLGRERGGA